jgi:cytochrome P450
MTTKYTIAPAPRSFPLLGHVPQLFRRPLELFQSIRAHGDVVIIRVGRSPAYVVNHPELIRQILVHDAKKFDKGLQFEKARPYVGNGLTTASEPLHLRQRRLMQPAFHHAQIARYADLMRESATAMIESWRPGQEVALNEQLLSFTVTVLARTLFSTDIDASVVSEFTEAMPALLDGLTTRVALPFEFLERLPTPGNRRFNTGRACLRAIIERFVAEHRTKGADRAGLLSILVNARDDGTGGGMTDEQLHDEVMTMLLAGTETVANTLSWACHLLGQHPECQGRLQAEVDEVLSGHPVGVEELRKLGYTQRVLTETLRMYPATWLLSRRPIADVEIGDHRIPAGSHVLFSPYGLHRDPELYPEPDRFHPDRWLGEHSNPKGGSRASFIPFGAGIRGCIGEPFAWTEMMIFLSTLAARRTLRPVRGRWVRPIVWGSLQPDRLSMIVEARSITAPRQRGETRLC